MADSSLGKLDILKLKVVELKKELKARGLSTVGDKSELITRLQDVVKPTVEESTELSLDSDEIDSDAVLEDDEDDNNHDLLLDDKNHDILDESAALNDTIPPATETKTNTATTAPTLKRKSSLLTTTVEEKKTKEDSTESKESTGRKIVLNRRISNITLEQNSSPAEPASVKEDTKINTKAPLTAKERLELRAKRFGLPVASNASDKIEARKLRFAAGSNSASSSAASGPTADKLKQRAERFGTSVSKFMTDVESKERLEKRKAKFGLVK